MDGFGSASMLLIFAILIINGLPWAAKKIREVILIVNGMRDPRIPF